MCATPRVRPRIVLNDPALSASQPMPDLAASAANALGHAVDGAVTALATPVPTLAARDAAGGAVVASAPSTPGRREGVTSPMTRTGPDADAPGF